MTDKQQTTSKQVRFQGLVFGEITASVLRAVATGYRFYDYELTRTWKRHGVPRKRLHG